MQILFPICYQYILVYLNTYMGLTWVRHLISIPDNKVRGANMGPIWGRQGPDGPHVGPMNVAIVIVSTKVLLSVVHFCQRPTLKGYSWFSYIYITQVFFQSVLLSKTFYSKYFVLWYSIDVVSNISNCLSSKERVFVYLFMKIDQKLPQTDLLWLNLEWSFLRSSIIFGDVFVSM